VGRVPPAAARPAVLMMAVPRGTAVTVRQSARAGVPTAVVAAPACGRVPGPV